jgi:hypothetical protein
MSELNVEPDGDQGEGKTPTDPLFELLTDALRGGPGSESWSAALARLSASPDMDDYALLLTARQRLESGKSFGTVKAGAGLTDAVMAGVAAAAESERDAMRIGRPKARTIAALAAAAALVIFSFAAIVFEVMIYSSDSNEVRVQLPSRRSDRTAGFQNFDSIIPVGWHPIGMLSVKADRGLRLASGEREIEQTGGLLRMEPLPANRHFDVEANIRYRGGASVAPQLFLTDNVEIRDDHVTDAGHEFVWTLLHDRPSVRLPDKTLQTDTAFLESGVSSTFGVKIKMNGASAAVEANFGNHKCSVWNGSHRLDADKPWRLGVRFVVLGDKNDDSVALESIRVTSH